MTSTLISWGMMFVLAGVAVYVYKPELIKKLVTSPQQAVQPVIDNVARPTNKRTKSKKAEGTKTSIGSSGDQSTESKTAAQSNKKRKVGSLPAERGAPAQNLEKPLPLTEDSSMNDREFAQQLAKTQTGTDFKSSQKQNKQEQRTRKQGKNNRLEPLAASTENSSTAGQDGDVDDNSSSADSAPFEPVASRTAASGDVSDMLEAPAAKPTTLRLTDIPAEAKKKSAAKPYEQVLSKKKRNEKARREEQKLFREESDRIHEAKKQEQLRTARMAAGTSNQTKANNFANTANAWTSGATKDVKAAPAGGSASAPAPLLDTFNPTTQGNQPHGAVHAEQISEQTNVDNANALRAELGQNRTSALAASSREGNKSAWADEMSEEEQMKLLVQQQQDDSWESVTSKKSKKKTKQDNDTGSEASYHRSVAAPSSTDIKTNGVKSNVVQTTSSASNRFGSFQTTEVSGMHDAEWEA